jgi:transposase-like protein
LFAAEIRKKRVGQMRAYSSWQWRLDEVFVKINGDPCNTDETQTLLNGIRKSQRFALLF